MRSVSRSSVTGRRTHAREVDKWMLSLGRDKEPSIGGDVKPPSLYSFRMGPRSDYLAATKCPQAAARCYKPDARAALWVSLGVF